MRGKIKEHLFIKVTVYLPFSFRKNLNKERYSIYGNLLPVFSTEGFRLEVKYTHQLQYFNRSIFSCNENEKRKGNLFKLIWFAITFAGTYAIGDNEKNKAIIKFSLSLSPSGKFPVRIWCQV